MEIGNPTPPAPSAAENARFLHEIEALSQALYLRRPTSTGRNRPPPPTKKLPAASGLASSSSIWNWKPLRALSSHIRSGRFNCRFTLHVHSVHGLPPPFDGAELQVHWRRRDGGAATRPAQVLAGSAEFGEALSYSCAVYGSRSGPQQSAKYEAKLFLLYVSVANGRFAGDADFGRHRVDLTSLLPATLEELEDERITGKWTTSFRLSGKAKGAILNVSFSFVVVAAAKKGFQSATLPTTDRKVQPAAAVARRGRSVDEVRILREVLPSARSEVAGSVASLREVPLVTSKSDVASLMRYEMELDGLPKGELITSLDGDDGEFSVVERGVEMCGKGLPSGEDDFGADDVLVGSVKLREIEKVEEFGMESYSGSPKSECSSIVIDSSRGNVKLLELEKFEELGIVDNGGSQMSDFNSYVIENSLANSKHEMEVVDDDAGEVDFSSAPNDTLSETVKLDEIDKCLSEVEDDLNVGPYMLETMGVEEIDELERMAEHEDANHDQVGSENERLLDEDAYNGQVVNVNERLLDEVLGKEDYGQSNLSVIERNEVDSPPFGGNVNYGDAKSNYKKRSKSYSFDDATDSIASEFLNMLGVEHSPFNLSSDSDPESPRERLWKQFEKESLAAGGGLFGLDIGYGPEQELFGDSSAQIDLCDEFQDEFSLFLQNTEAESRMADNVDKGKTRAKMLEDLETEALMREWGLNEKTFQRSAPDYSGGFGSPINLLPEDPIEPPPLAEGLGSFIQTKDGGFLRSMSPSLFKNTKNNSSLIMQVSSPVVVPAEMGAGVIEIMQHLASVGAEKLSIQANKLMPLEDITGKTMQQVAWEAVPSLEARERMDGSDQLNWGSTSANYAPDSSRRNKRNSRSSKNISCSYASDLESEYVSIEELAPLAMDKIETLSIEGLRVQSGMSDEEAPSNICAQSFGDISALEGARARYDGSIVLDGVAGLQLLDIKGGNEDVDGLMSLSLSLDDWMRLDAGMVDEDEQDEQDDSRTSKILAAHHANCTTNDLVSGRWKSDKRGERGKKWGLLGNNFTVALMVQLRDPLRNYEPVGTSMLALIQVERVFVPPKPKIYNSVSETIRSEESDDEAAQSTEAKRDVQKEDPETELIAQFKITDVHVAGIKTEPTKKKLWGSSTQQQSGSRWLLASGMGKNNKHALMKSKPVTRSSQVTAAPPLASTTSMVQPAESLWSISSRLFGYGARWREPAAPNPPVRNPNVAFPSQTVKLR